MVKHAIIAAVITLLLFNSGLFVFAVPVPIFYLYSVYHRKSGLAAVLMSFAAGTVLMLFGIATAYDQAGLAYFLLISAVMGECAVRKVKLSGLAAASIFIPWVCAVAAVAVSELLIGFGIVGKFRENFSAVLTNALQMQETFTSLPAAQLAYLKENTGVIANFAINTLPAASLVFTMLIVSLTVLLGRVFTKKFGALKYFGNIAVLQFPFWPVWLLISCAALYFMNSYLLGADALKFLAFNGLIFCAGVFFIEGCFVLSFWLNKGRSPFLRLLVYGVIIVFLQVVGFMIIALGLSDQWLDLRKRHLKQSQA